MSVAVTAASALVTHERPGRRAGSTTLMPAILALLAEAGLGLADLDAIAFGRGPGAFTGLRTACAVAQGLAFGAGKPVLPIDTLLAVAEDARAGAATLSRAGRRWMRAWTRSMRPQYRYAGGRWTTLVAPMLADCADARARAGGDAPPRSSPATRSRAFGERLRHRRRALRCPDARADAPRALLRLAPAAWRDGAGVDAAAGAAALRARQGGPDHGRARARAPQAQARDRTLR